MKQVVVDRGIRPNGMLDDPASSTRASRSPVTPDAAVGDPGSVRAVLVERVDATCVLYCGGPVGEWPSLDHAWDAVAKIDPHLEWRASTPGVWVGVPRSVPCPSDDGPGALHLDTAGATNESAMGGAFTVARLMGREAAPGRPDRR